MKERLKRICLRLVWGTRDCLDERLRETSCDVIIQNGDGGDCGVLVVSPTISPVSNSNTWYHYTKTQWFHILKKSFLIAYSHSV